MPDKLAPANLHLQPITIKAPSELDYHVDSLKTVFDAVQYRAPTYNRRKELFISFCLTYINISFLPKYLQPLARPLIRWKLGKIYDLLHKLLTY